MMNLLVFRERLKTIYRDYGIAVTIIWKFCMVLLSLTMLNSFFGSVKGVSNIFIMIVIALACAFIPNSLIVFVMSSLFMYYMYSVSLELTIVLVALMMLMFLFYYGMKPRNSILLLLVPLAFYLRIPYLIPILIGLTGNITVALPASFGVMIYYVMLYVRQNAVMLESETNLMDVQRYIHFIDNFIGNKTMLVTIIAFAITIIAVYIIRRLSVEYAWAIAIGVGIVVQIVTVLIGAFMFRLNFSVTSFIFSVLICALLSYAAEFFLFALDYTHTEYTQFEDDEYYYYVKVVPKIVVTVAQPKVQSYTANKGDNDKRRSVKRRL